MFIIKFTQESIVPSVLSKLYIPSAGIRDLELVTLELKSDMNIREELYSTVQVGPGLGLWRPSVKCTYGI